jgi:DNA-nicking Smr family endonuclease
VAGDEHNTDPGVKFGALLEPLLGRLAPVEPEPVAAPEPERRRLDEEELMALIFSHLDHENPRVCEGIEFERLVILSKRAAEPARIDAPQQPDPPSRPAPSEPPRPALELDVSNAWIGRSWADDISTVPAALLDRPELDTAQRELVARAGKRERATLNLRRLYREPAMRHLQLFVHACRSQRVRLCRVITGKGVHSSDEPVLKRAVLEWCRGPGREAVIGWAPLLDHHGEWGTVVLELRSMARPA